MIRAKIIRLITKGLSAGRKRSKPSRSPVELSGFGRITMQRYRLIASGVQHARRRIINYLPLSASREVRDFTIKIILECVIKDITFNHNKEELSDHDISDLGSFIELAYSVANSSTKIDSQLSICQCAIYREVLSGLLLDWLENWNAAG